MHFKKGADPISNEKGSCAFLARLVVRCDLRRVINKKEDNKRCVPFWYIENYNNIFVTKTEENTEFPISILIRTVRSIDGTLHV